MGSFIIIASVLSVILFIGYSEAVASSCPLPSKVYSCSPKCKDNYECGGKICCPNSCNAKSCVDVNAAGGDRGQDRNSQSGGPGTYCNNQKCNSFEVCKLDPATKRMKCMRA